MNEIKSAHVGHGSTIFFIEPGQGIEMTTKKTKSSETQHFNLENVVMGYLALEYACGILSITESKQFPGFMCYLADGSPIITYRPVDAANNTMSARYHIAQIRGVQFPVSGEYSVSDIRQIFLCILAGKSFDGWIKKFRIVQTAKDLLKKQLRDNLMFRRKSLSKIKGPKVLIDTIDAQLEANDFVIPGEVRGYHKPLLDAEALSGVTETKEFDGVKKTKGWAVKVADEKYLIMYYENYKGHIKLALKVRSTLR